MSKPYRKVYPNATPAQWKCKGKDMEKFVRVMELIDPGVDPMDVCKVDEAVEEEEEEEMYPGILDQSKVSGLVPWLTCINSHFDPPTCVYLYS